MYYLTNVWPILIACQPIGLFKDNLRVHNNSLFVNVSYIYIWVFNIVCKELNYIQVYSSFLGVT